MENNEHESHLYCHYTFPIDLAPNRIPFGVKSIGKVQLQIQIWSRRYYLEKIHGIHTWYLTYAQRNVFEILLNQPDIRSYLPLIDFQQQTDSIRLMFQNNQKMVNTIWFRLDSIRFRKDLSVYIPRLILYLEYWKPGLGPLKPIDTIVLWWGILRGP